MKRTDMKNIPSRDEIVQLAKLLATPIDTDQMEREGLIEKKGAWFKIKNINELPDHARKQVRNFRIDGTGDCYVKFPKSWIKAQRSYKKMTGKEYTE